MTRDAQHIRRIRQALARLQGARSYQQQATRMVKLAEVELAAAVRSSLEPARTADAVAAADESGRADHVR